MRSMSGAYSAPIPKTTAIPSANTATIAIAATMSSPMPSTLGPLAQAASEQNPNPSIEWCAGGGR